MSHQAPTVPAVIHPWRLIRAMRHVEVRWEAEPGLVGSWCERTKTMRFDPGQNQAERRCTALHEWLHAQRGDTTCDWRTHRDAARLLVDLDALATALLAHGETNPEAVAEELWVDEDTLTTRLKYLHPSERGYLRRRLSMREATA